MKALTIQGTEKQINNFILDNELLIDLKDRLEVVETRVYVVDTHSLVNKHHTDLTDEKFMSLAEEQGTVHTLLGFTGEYNIGRYDSPHYVIRFINVAN